MPEPDLPFEAPRRLRAFVRAREISIIVLAAGVGLLGGLGVAVWVCFQVASSVVATAATVMLAALPLMIGSQMLISALQLDIQSSPSRPYPRSTDPQQRRASGLL